MSDSHLTYYENDETWQPKADEWSSTKLGDIQKALLALKDAGATSVWPGLGKPTSYRGHYDQVAFVGLAALPIEVCLMNLDEAMIKTFHGWKGGEYNYGESTPAWVVFDDADLGWEFPVEEMKQAAKFDPTHVIDGVEYHYSWSRSSLGVKITDAAGVSYWVPEHFIANAKEIERFKPKAGDVVNVKGIRRRQFTIVREDGLTGMWLLEPGGLYAPTDSLRPTKGKDEE